MQRRQAINRKHRRLSVKQQCCLMSINRSSFYYKPVEITESELALMKAIDRQYLATPFYGSRKMAACLKSEELAVNRKRVCRLMRLMGLKAIYRRPRTSPPGKGNKIYPYALKGLKINRPNQVWAADITYIPMQKGFLYLVVIMDWYSRYVLAWRLSNTMETDFCVEALKEALKKGRPDIFNTDQGSQFTSREFVSILESLNIKVSMDGSGRYADNLFIERLWRTLKYEEVYLKAYQDATVARIELAKYIVFYNAERPHQSLGYKTPAEEYYAEPVAVVKDRMLESETSRVPVLNSVRIAGNHLNLE
jgi:putative transposase